jgi:hypothetical protein
LVLLSLKRNFENENWQSFKYANSLQKLHRLNHKHGTIDELFIDYLKSGTELFMLESGFLAVYSGSKLVVKHTFGPISNSLLIGTSIDSSAFFMKNVIQGQSVRFNNDINLPPQSFLNKKVLSLLAAPINLNDQKYGAIVFLSNSDSENELTEFESDLLDLLAK